MLYKRKLLTYIVFFIYKHALKLLLAITSFLKNCLVTKLAIKLKIIEKFLMGPAMGPINIEK